jgi:hypothetical protein
MGTRRRVWGYLAASAVGLSLFGMAGPPAHADGYRPAAQVDISPYAKEAQRGAIIVHLTARCRPGNVVQELIIGYSQNGFSHEQPAGVDLPCDGLWHRLRVTGPEAFEPGPAHITARLTVIDQVTGDPKPQAVDSQQVWVEPAAKVAIGKYVKLADDGTAVVAAWVRCDQPWVAAGLVVELVQGDVGGASGTASLPGEFISCDDRWHGVFLRVTPAETPFSPGPARVLAFFDVLDPISFDPVAQAQANTNVWIWTP